MPTRPEVVIVDIDRVALARLGAWPWPRGQLARVVAAAAKGKPAVIALDMLPAGPDRWSADGDALLANALGLAVCMMVFLPSLAAFRLHEPPGAGIPGKESPS